ncbi:hypothetical protein [Hymenobacter terrenus]|uniref:hypothetical protein n=1 Tax=Hymenobacter terrenus TaxID=1629124 RepID=UPI000619B0D4|nr:hypothetical protein [Hymenobacter terrenus]
MFNSTIKKFLLIASLVLAGGAVKAPITVERRHSLIVEPSLCDGQQVIAWPVSERKWEYLHNTKCVVDYDDTVTVRAIFANDLFKFNSEGLTLHATRVALAGRSPRPGRTFTLFGR